MDLKINIYLYLLSPHVLIHFKYISHINTIEILSQELNEFFQNDYLQLLKQRQQTNVVYQYDDRDM